MTRKQKRFAGIAAIGAVIAIAATLVAVALRDEIVFFFDPTDIVVEGKAKPGDKFRLGGLVAEGSLSKSQTIVRFTVTDGANSIDVTFDGILPDIFREGQGVIAEGELTSSTTFRATNVLAKHDEKYIPKELEGVLKDKQIWKGDQAQ